ncbi:hypothetical protein [Rickettsia endosymbiont of Cardiosporidium cionae]|uniref:hypothetical protein n=1 Tax=Rickettsia endosymbiont of Cardiosporidium cionae TaxID=2777155 RepID=UPI0018953BA3|nr:hypothetical protein [Rickettsia endosymbiont of Cardiosporidium cionae]KAF8818117.1 hypothetical protein IHI24_000845 [Rickettsia endosymbiont of Cardiosporidium cionae]
MKHNSENYSPIFYWKINSVISLGISGIYSLILVMLRTPYFSSLFENKELFQSALVVHVNLSTLIWLLSVTVTIWKYNSKNFYFEHIFAKSGLISTLLISISPFISKGSVPIMNNYIPMLDNAVFIIGLVLFIVILLCIALVTLYESVNALLFDPFDNSLIHTCIIVKITSAVIYIIVFICFMMSLIELRKIIDNVVNIDIHFYYELLYWSGGHILQFLYTEILMFALFVYVNILLGNRSRFIVLYQLLFILNVFLSLLGLYPHFALDITDSNFILYYTLHMKYCAGFTPTVFIFAVLYEILIYIKNDDHLYVQKSVKLFLYIVIFMTSFMFLFGGAIALMITDTNVTIPAHYHGSIVSVTIACMGLVYLYCYNPILYFKLFSKSCCLQQLKITSNPSQKFIKFYSTIVQICLITFGQTLHITGLALAGGYSVLRKTSGVVGFPTITKIYMAMFGIGGVIAIIAGLMFIYLCIKQIFRSSCSL